MLPDRADVSIQEYIAMLFVLNETRAFEGRDDGASLARAIAPFNEGGETPEAVLESMFDRDLLEFRRSGKPLFAYAPDAKVSLGKTGFAFLINFAEEFIEKIRAAYKEIPDNSLSALIPYLDLKRVPAADRHVKTTDNLPAFKTLEESLEAIRAEVLRDYNSRQLDLADPRAVVADIDSVLSQIKSGYVRLSDLTQKVRPLLKELASVCKDVIVIATAVSSGLVALEAILHRLY